MNITVASVSLALLLGADAPATAPDLAASPPALQKSPQLQRVAVQFHKIAPADPAKRDERKMQMQINRRYTPLVLVTHPDGSQSFEHGPQQEIELIAPAEQPQ